MFPMSRDDIEAIATFLFLVGCAVLVLHLEEICENAKPSHYCEKPFSTSSE